LWESGVLYLLKTGKREKEENRGKDGEGGKHGLSINSGREITSPLDGKVPAIPL